jgi:hypothetical protein
MPKLHQDELRSINYGHFGIPLYNSSLKKWTFSKLTESNARFEQLGNIEELAQGKGSAKQETYLRDQADDREERYDRALEAELRQLIVGFPEIQSAEDLVRPMVRLSEGIAHALSEYDPAIGELLSIGNATRTLEHGQEMIRLLGMPGGQCGEALRLVRLRNQVYDFAGGRTFSIDTLSEEAGWWTGKGAPIQQICFARTLNKEEKNSLLAVRLPGCVIMMFPRIRARPVPAPGIKLEQPPGPSRIDPNVLFELSSQQAHGQQLSDVAFNPWNKREFVVIDQAGQWTTFSVERKSEKAPVYKPKTLNQGQLPQPPADEDEEDEEEERQQQQAQSEVPEVPAEEIQEPVQDESTAPNSRESSVSGIPRLKIEALASRTASRIVSPFLEDNPHALSEADVAINSENGGRQEVEEVDADADADDVREVIKLRHDGWARITWILDKMTLMACTRKVIHIVDITSGKCFDMPKLLPEGKRSVDWHLDMQVCWNHPDHVFVLTSNAIFLVKVSTKLDKDALAGRMSKGNIVISALHFRDHTDISLHMHVNADGGDYFVTIYSQYNKIATCFRFEVPSSVQEQTSVSDAIPFVMPEDVGNRTLALSIRRVHMDDNLYGMSPSDATSVEDLHSVQFLGREFGLRHGFFMAKGPSSQERTPWPQPVGIVDTGTDFSKRFVVPDGYIERIGSDDESDLDIVPPDTLLPPRNKKAKYQHRHAAQNVEGTFEESADALVPHVHIDALSNIIQSAVMKQKDAEGPQKTLFEHAEQALPYVDDLRDASFALEDAFGCSTASAAIRVYPQSLPLSLADELDEEMPFDNLHAYLEENYLTPLDESFPDAFVLQRGELVKSVAAELTLASSCIEYKLKDEGMQEDVDMDDLYAKPSQLSQAFSQNDDEREGRSMLPTSSATRSQISRLGSPYDIPVNTIMNDIIQRLQRNVTLDVKATQQWSLKPAVILNHWELGADPGEYSYRKTKKRLEEEKSFTGLSEKEQRRLLRKQERDQLRKRREARRAERLTHETSQAPTIASSQVLEIDSQLPASQVPDIGSQAPRLRSRPIQSSKVPGFRSQAPAVNSSQVPGFGSQKPTKPRRKEAPGFGGQPLPTPSRSKPVPGFGSQPLPTPSRSRPVPGFSSQPGPSDSQRPSQASKEDASGKKAKKNDTAAVAGNQDRGEAVSQAFELPVRRSSTKAEANRLFRSSQRPEGSRRPTGSQPSASQTPRKKRSRMEGF